MANEKRRQMAAEELLLMQTADQKFQQAQIEKAANRRAALEDVTATNLKMVCNFSFLSLILGGI